MFALKDNIGSWIIDKEDLKEMAFNFFRNLNAKEDQFNDETFR